MANDSNNNKGTLDIGMKKLKEEDPERQREIARKGGEARGKELHEEAQQRKANE